jgi:hypothetical protein
VRTTRNNQDCYLNGNAIATRATVEIDQDAGTLKVLQRRRNKYEPTLVLTEIEQQAMTGDMQTWVGKRGNAQATLQWKRSSSGGCGCRGGR